jgi:hypothetical protein
VIEEILTGMRVKQNIQISKGEDGKGKKVQYFINKQIIQSKTIGGEKSEPRAIAC